MATNILFAFFGSRGLYCYTLDGELVWQKDFGALRMYNNFGEGAWTALDGNKLVLVLDQEGESFLIALDKTSGRELWRISDGRLLRQRPAFSSSAGVALSPDGTVLMIGSTLWRIADGSLLRELPRVAQRGAMHRKRQIQ